MVTRTACTSRVLCLRTSVGTRLVAFVLVDVHLRRHGVVAHDGLQPHGSESHSWGRDLET